MTNNGKVMSIGDQAEMLDDIIARCTMRDGSPADISDLTLTVADVVALRSLSDRLWRIAPHEDAIKKVVLGR